MVLVLIVAVRSKGLVSCTFASSPVFGFLPLFFFGGVVSSISPPVGSAEVPGIVSFPIAVATLGGRPRLRFVEASPFELSGSVPVCKVMARDCIADFGRAVADGSVEGFPLFGGLPRGRMVPANRAASKSSEGDWPTGYLRGLPRPLGFSAISLIAATTR